MLLTGDSVARSQERTEKPTERRKREARREGRIAKSTEVGIAVSMLALLIALRGLAPNVVGQIAERTHALLASSGQGFLGPDLGSNVRGLFLVGLLPFLGVATVLGLAGGLAQVGFTMAPIAAKPKLSNLSIKKGLQRFKPSVVGWELVKTALKLGLLAAVVWGPLSAWIARLGQPLGLVDAVGFTGSQVWALGMRATILALAIAVTDYTIVRVRTARELKISKQELKEELKHSEGDPVLKQARRRRALEMSRNRMIAEVGLADVVITNPTRLALAVRYDATEPAPRVVAKGANKLAAKIRTEAYRNGVTVLEDRQLARTLYRRVRVGGFIPASLFEAVATVLAVAYRRRRRRWDVA